MLGMQIECAPSSACPTPLPPIPLPPPLCPRLQDLATAAGYTPLHYAAWYRQRDAVQVLITNGASLYMRLWVYGIDPEVR